MQVSRLQESSTDYRKFYIHNGTKTMRLRAETKCAIHLLIAMLLQRWKFVPSLTIFPADTWYKSAQGGQMGVDDCFETGQGGPSHSTLSW